MSKARDYEATAKRLLKLINPYGELNEDLAQVGLLAIFLELEYRSGVVDGTTDTLAIFKGKPHTQA